MANKIQVKRGVFASLPTLDSGEFGWCTDTHQVFIGTNATNYEVLMHQLFSANSILAADSDDTPAALTVAEQTVVGRLTSGNITDISLGISDNNILQIDGSPNDDEYARFTANGLEGRTESEFKADFNLQIGTDVLAEQTIGIADDNLLEVDGTPADNDFAKFTAAGLEGRSYAETLADLSGQAAAAFSFGSEVVTIGTPTADAHAATKKYVDDLVTAGIFWVGAVLDKDTLAPPGGESTGDRYWIGGTGTGTWAGHDYDVAEYNGSGWDYTSAAEGMAAYVDDENLFYFYNGSTLQVLSSGTGAHASTHVSGGGDEIDGDTLDIDWNPSYYTPGTSPSEVSSADELTAHLYGIDQEINTLDTGKASTNHDSTHVRGGSDEIDGDTIDIDFTPSNYTPSTTPGEVTNVDELSAHLAGIDDELSTLGTASDFTDLGDTPGVYTGHGGKVLRVNSTPDGVEFVDFTSTYLEATPSNGETDKAPNSDWAYDHDVATTGVHGAGANTLLHSGSTIDGGAFT